MLKHVRVFARRYGVFFLLNFDNGRSVSADATAMHIRPGAEGEFETGFAFTRFYDGSELVVNAYIDKADNLSGWRDESEQ